VFAVLSCPARQSEFRLLMPLSFLARFPNSLERFESPGSVKRDRSATLVPLCGRRDGSGR